MGPIVVSGRPAGGPVVTTVTSTDSARYHKLPRRIEDDYKAARIHPRNQKSTNAD